MKIDEPSLALCHIPAQQGCCICVCTLSTYRKHLGARVRCLQKHNFASFQTFVDSSQHFCDKSQLIGRLCQTVRCMKMCWSQRQNVCASVWVTGRRIPQHSRGRNSTAGTRHPATISFPEVSLIMAGHPPPIDMRNVAICSAAE